MTQLKGLDLVRLAAITALFQSGCVLTNSTGKENKSAPVSAQQQTGIRFYNMTPKEEKDLKEFLDNYAANSPAANKVLQELKKRGTVIEYFEKDMDEDRVIDAGLSSRDRLSLNRLAFEEESISFANTTFHESEHVLHLNAAYENGINALSFKSLNDIYIYCTLMEALAYRKAALVCAEYDNGPTGFEQAKQVGEDAFDKRMIASDKPLLERWSYEQSAMAHLLLETNALPNQIYFPRSPNWNQVASILSRGEVTKVSHLPEPSLMFINECILKEMEKHPDATSIDEFDMSCALDNQSSLRKDELAIKKMIFGVLMAIHDSCSHTHKPLLPNTRNSFLYWMGWPDGEQMKSIEAHEVTFTDVQETNLSEFTTEQMFAAAEKLISSPEVQSYHTEETENYGKMLHFSRQILLPPRDIYTRIPEKTR